MMRASGSRRWTPWIAAIVLVAAVAGAAWLNGDLSNQDWTAVPMPEQFPEDANTTSRSSQADTVQVRPDSSAPSSHMDIGSQDPPAGESDATSGQEKGLAQKEDPTDLPPRLDELRHEADGVVVIAGRVAPDTEVVLRLDGSEFARAAADATGAFATIALLAPSDAARVLTLSQVDASGHETVSPDELILAPATLPASNEQIVDEPTNLAANLLPVTADERQVAELDESRHAPVVRRSDGPSVSRGAPAADTDAPLPASEPTSKSAEPAADADQDSLETTTAATTVSSPQQTAETSRAPAATASVAGLHSSDRDLDEGSLRQLTPRALSPSLAVPAVDPRSPDAPLPGPARQVVVLRSNEEGVSVMRSAGARPEAMRQVVLDSISYTEAGDVQLEGRAQHGAREVRIYLDNRAVAALDVTASGTWRGSLSATDTGLYTLRIDEVDAAGRVSSRVETPFKREAPEVLVAATRSTTAKVSAVTVQKGDTLWAISRDRYGEGILYVRVFEANRESIRDPDLIYPGQIFTLPSD